MNQNNFAQRHPVQLRADLAQRLLQLQDAQRLWLVSPYFLQQHRFHSHYTARFLRLLFTATLMEQQARAVLQISLGDLAALLGCRPRTAQAAVTEAEQEGWCTRLPSFSPSPHRWPSARLPDGYTLTAQFCLCAQNKGAAS